jgi:hypothetical protein
MDNALSMGEAQRRGHVAGDPHGIADRELWLATKPDPKRFPADVGHDIVEQAVGLARVNQSEHVRVTQAGGDLHFALEPLHPEDLGEVRMEDLDRDRSAVLQVLGEIDGGHAAAAKLALELIPLADRGLEPILQIGRAVSVGCHVGNIGLEETSIHD